MSAMTTKLILNAEQAKRGKRLFWTIIELAVIDACSVPLKDRRPMAKAITAMRFLTTNIDKYLVWLDVDAGSFRKRLFQAMYAEHTDKFSESDKRAFRYNYSWWNANKDSLTALDWKRIHEQEERHS
jgi:hypothetical protein